MPTFINEAVLSLPEQVEKNKNDIKAIEETIGGIDPNLINQVQTNTSDISAIKQEQIVQNTAINQNGGKITALETKTTNINANGTQYGSVEKVANADGVMEISADGLTLESNDVLDIITPNANINVNNSGVVKISNDNNTNKLEYDGANGSFKVSGGHTLEFDSATGDLTIDGQGVGGGLHTHYIILGGGGFKASITIIDNNPSNLTLVQVGKWLYNNGFTGFGSGGAYPIAFNTSNGTIGGVVGTSVGVTNVIYYSTYWTTQELTAIVNQTTI